MADTARSLSELLALHANNQTKAISAQDARDFIVSALGGHGSMMATPNQVLAITAGTPLKIAWANSEEVATDITADTVNDRFTVTAAGLYEVAGMFTTQGAVATNCFTEVHVNGALVKTGPEFTADAGPLRPGVGTFHVPMLAGDYVELFLDITAGGPTNITVLNLSRFTIKRLS